VSEQHPQINVLKRDGTTNQGFEASKIYRAIEAAWEEVHKTVDPKKIQKVVDLVYEVVGSRSTVTVEELQDLVEVSLMRKGHYDVAKSYVLFRARRAEQRNLETAIVDGKAISEYVHASKYARYRPDLLRREVYKETVDRVKGMHLSRFPELKEDIESVFALVHDKRLLPSMRSMQFAGEAILRNHTRLYNCTATLVDRLEAFSEALYLLLAGCGVGYSVQFEHIEKLPEIQYIDPKKVEHHVIEDTIEGWANGLKALLQSFQKGTNLELSYHLIRPAGTPLKTSGGNAPGHLQLKKSLELIRGVLLGAQGRKLRPIECHKIMCLSADAVLSGGIRRSASICLFSLDDSEMLYAKTGNWYETNPWFANANNSVVLKRDDVKKKNFKRVFQMLKQWGEPGFFFVSDYDFVTNPCFHPETRLWTSKGYQKISDMFSEGSTNLVMSDVRVGKGDSVEVEINRGSVVNGKLGVAQMEATKVFLTQKNAPVYKLVTSHGHEIITTITHEYPTPQGRRQLKDLQSGDTLFLPSGEGFFGSGGTLDEGFLLGSYVGDGTSDSSQSYIDLWEADFELKSYIKDSLNSLISGIPTFGKRTYGEVGWQKQTTPKDSTCEKVRIGAVRFDRWLESKADSGDRTSLKKRVPESVWTGSRDFVVGYIRGLFATDGTVLLGGMGSKATLSLRLTQANKQLLQDVQILLSMFGVQSSLYSRQPEGFRNLPSHTSAGLKEYWCSEVFELCVNRPNILVFMERVGLVGPKANILEDRLGIRGVECRKPERHTTKVVSISPAGTSDVYCLTQPTTNSVIANGIVTGQCCEIGLYPILHVTPEMQTSLAEKGIKATLGPNTGWSFCNLTEINAAKLTSYEDFEEVAKAATILGTLQASYTTFPYLGWVSEEIVKRDALLGVGMTGIMDSPHIALNPEYQKKIALKVKEWNAEFASKIGTNPAARTTCIKPSGSTSLELGAVGSGIHAHHAKRYIRRIQAVEIEPIFQEFRKVNPHACIRKPDGKWVIEFPIEAPEGAILKGDQTAIEFLDTVRSTQLNWVVPGTALDHPGYNGSHHNVSNTVVVRPEEWDLVAEYIWKHKEDFTGVSLLPSTGDKDYSFAPLEAVTTEADQKRWTELATMYKPVDYSAMLESEDGTNLAAEPACAGGVCEVQI